MIVVAMLYESGNSRTLGKDPDKAKELYRRVVASGRVPRAVTKAQQRLKELE
jgi:hypothetical protein